MDDFLDYETTQFVPVEQAGAPYENVEVNYWYPPVNFQMQAPRAGLISEAIPDQVAQTETSIPEGRIAISEGAQVMSADDKQIGNVEQVIIHSENNTVTHFVIAKGFLLKAHKLVPAAWVTSADDDKIRLSVEARLFDSLPDYNPDLMMESKASRLWPVQRQEWLTPIIRRSRKDQEQQVSFQLS